MEKASQNTLDTPKGISLFNALSYVFSGLGGLITTRYLINDEAHANLKKYGAFDDLLAGHRGRLQDATKASVEAVHKGQLNTNELTDALSKEQREFYPKFEKRMADMGVGNVMKEWKTIHRNQRFTSVISGLAVTGVALGATMEISRRMEEKLSSEEQQRS